MSVNLQVGSNINGSLARSASIGSARSNTSTGSAGSSSTADPGSQGNIQDLPTGTTIFHSHAHAVDSTNIINGTNATNTANTTTNGTPTATATAASVVSHKRSKISRACDECRRKKIRCDGGTSASDGAAIVPCSSCRKSGDRCSFSRVPLKRGPSKRLGSMKTDFIPVYSHSKHGSNGSNNIANTSGYIQHGTPNSGAPVINLSPISHTYRHRSLSDIGIASSPPPPLPHHHHHHPFNAAAHMAPLGSQRRPSASSMDDQSSGSSTGSIGGAGRLHPRLPSIDSLTSAPNVQNTASMPAMRPAPNAHANAYFSKASSGSNAAPNAIFPIIPTTVAKPHSHIVYQSPMSGNSMGSSASDSDVLLSPKSESGGISPLTGPNVTSFSGGSSISNSAIPPLSQHKPFSSTAPPVNNLSATSGYSNNQNHQLAPLSVSEEELVGWDDRCIDCYYQLVHSTLPVLPANRIRLRLRLQSCQHPNIREALLHSVSGLVSNNIEELANIDYRSQVVRLLPLAVSALDVPSKILFLMTSILCYLQTSETAWLGSAIGTAFDLKSDIASREYEGSIPSPQKRRSTGVSATSSNSSTSGSQENESDEILVRRLFLLLVLLNCLHATVKSVPLMISDSAISISQEQDEECFDIAGSFASKRTGVEMVRLGLLAAQINSSTYDTSMGLNGLKQSLLQIKVETERLWDSSPILKALYHYVKVVYDRKARDVDALIRDIGKLVILLDSPLASVSPLVSFFIPMLRNTLLDIKQTGNHSKALGVISVEMRSTVIKQLDLLDNLIIRKFPEFGKSHLQQHRLQGLAAIAQLSETIYAKCD